MVGGGGGPSMKLKRAARKLFQACGSFSFSQHPPPVLPSTTVVSSASAYNSPKSHHITDMVTAPDSITTTSSKTMCAICLEGLNYTAGTGPGQAIFTAQCSHAFHFDCIASNVRHGGVTCPICRAQWTHLPRNLKIPPCSYQTGDPVLQILDDSIATFRVHRRSILRSARYDDDDPIEPNHGVDHPRLHLSILSEPLSHPSFTQCLHQTHLSSQDCLNSSSSLSAEPAYRTCLCVRLAHQPAIDLVLVACPNGPHLRLIKQSMALVVFSLRPNDRLAVVTYSSAAARVFPLRRMTSYGKRAALQVIDRLFYMGQADPAEGLKKGVKVLGDRAYENPHSCILHLSDNPNPTRSYQMEVEVEIHRFHVGYSFGTSNGYVMHEFEEFLAGVVMGYKLKEVQLRIREDGHGHGRIVRIGELTSGEERRIPIKINSVNQHGNVDVSVGYSYIEDGVKRTGEVVVVVGEKREETSEEDGRSSSSGGSWDYHDPYMARRWAKHLHAYRL